MSVAKMAAAETCSLAAADSATLPFRLTSEATWSAAVAFSAMADAKSSLALT